MTMLPRLVLSFHKVAMLEDIFNWINKTAINAELAQLDKQSTLTPTPVVLLLHQDHNVLVINNTMLTQTLVITAHSVNFQETTNSTKMEFVNHTTKTVIVLVKCN